jgi:hypothetical protein
MARKTLAEPAPEWSFMVDADKVGSSDLKLSLKPNEEERKNLARRLGIKTLESLEADLSFAREAGTIHVTGTLRADVKQECVVSGKPCPDHITEEFEAWYADKDKTVSLAKARHEKQVHKGGIETPILSEAEDPEPLIEGKIDAGELITQYLSLSINPYPHAEGVEYEHGDDAPPPPKLDNPFAALKDWKGKKNKE